jgi:predicted RNase H-like HicB family nuclease
MKNQRTFKRGPTVKPTEEFLRRAQQYFDQKWAAQLLPGHKGEYAVVNPDLDLCVIGVSPGPTIAQFLEQAPNQPFKIIRIGYDTRASFAGFEKRERFDNILTKFAQLDEDTYEEPGEVIWREVQSTKTENVTFHARVFKEGDVYVALCPELNVSSFGDDVESAAQSLQEAIEAFIETCKEMGTWDEVLEEAKRHQEGAA